MPKLKHSNETFWVIFKQCEFRLKTSIFLFSAFQASFLAPKRPNTHYCQDEITAGCAHMIVKETLRNFVSGHYQAECTKPCVQPQYKLSQFALNMWPRKVQNTSRYIMTSNSIWIFKRHLLSFQTLSVLEDNKC